MVTYDAIATKDDKQFKRACFYHIPKWLRREVADDCKEAFAEAYAAELCDIKKPNAAKRAANLVMMKAAREHGMTDWREWQKLKTSEQPVKRGYAASPYVKPVKQNYHGPSILEMAEQQRKKQSRG